MPKYTPKEQQVINFLNQALSDPYLDLSVYKDNEFCDTLRQLALNHIYDLLFKMHIAQLHDEAANRIFKIESVINSRHTDTGCTLLDYALLAGLDELALRFASIGTEHSRNIDAFKMNIYSDFKHQRPEIVDNILSSVTQIELGQESYKNAMKAPEPFYRQCINYVKAGRKFSLLLLIGGLCCIAASPISGGLSTVLLLTVGIPAVIASVTSFQYAHLTEQARAQVTDQSRVYFEAKEIRNLMKLSRETRLNLTERPCCDHVHVPHSDDIEIKVTSTHPLKYHESADPDDNKLIFLNSRLSSPVAEPERDKHTLTNN